MRIVGIDEAGRGPVIGSMFVGGVAVSEDRIDDLQQMGLKDSKKLSDSRRNELGTTIEEYADAFFVKEITASEIDELRNIMSLNVIELKAFATVITELEADKAFIDLPEPDGKRFGRKLRNELGDGYSDLEVVAEHKADDTYPVVSAASILAKNAREDHIDRLKEKYGVNFRSGYPHDKPTIQFLKDYVAMNGELPAETRRSWSTAERILNESKQRSFNDF